MQSRIERSRIATVARPERTAGPRWLRLGIATILGVAAGTMLFATEAQGRPAARRPQRDD